MLKLNNLALTIALYIALLFVSCVISFSSWAINNNTLNIKQHNNTPLRIAVAANFTPVLKKLLIDFKKNTGIETQVISGASGAIYLQLTHGAPFDIFLSADSRRPKALEQANLIIKHSRKTYAIGQLALYNSQSNQPNFTSSAAIKTVLKKIPKHFAIANPTIAPYGKAAQETLQHLGLWSTYSKVLIKGININQTFAQIRSKSVESGLISQSQLVLNNLRGTVIPSHFHQEITQQLVILKNSKNIIKAQQLSKFLLLPRTQQVIINYGYAKPEVTI